jgi:hypothetical protein
LDADEQGDGKMIAGLLINGFEEGVLEENGGGWTGLLFHACVAIIMRQFFRKLAFAVMVKGNASAGRFALVAVGLTIATADRSVFFGTDRGYGLA